MNIQSKLPADNITIFTIMSAMAKEYDAINLGQGFPDYDCHPELLSLVTKYVNDEKNQYCPMQGLPALRKILAKKANDAYSCNIDASQLCITAGATQALFTAITAFIHSGDEVIIIEPAYDSYAPSILINGGLPIPYTLKFPDYSIDWDAFKNLVTDRTRMIIINTPHNPTGTILRQSDLEALEAIVENKNIVVLSDEVYEHLIFDNEAHQSVLRFPKLFEQSLAVYSFGKTFHSTGWKMGYCLGPDTLMKEFINVHQWNVFCVNSFLQYAITDYLQNPINYLQLPKLFQQKRDFLTESLLDTPLKSIRSKGTYFQLYNYEEVSNLSDIEFSKYLTKEIGVACIPLSPFYSNPSIDKVIRFCFAKQETTLSAAAERLKKLK